MTIKERLVVTAKYLYVEVLVNGTTYITNFKNYWKLKK